MSQIDDLITELTNRVQELSQRVAFLERLESVATDSSGPFVLRAGDIMPGPGGLTIDPAAAIAGGLLVLDSPGTDNTKYVYKFRANAADLVTLTEAGTWSSQTFLTFATNQGIQSGSSGANIHFPAGGGGTGNINLNPSAGSGRIMGVVFLTPVGNGIVYSYDGVDGTARPVVDNGADDVLYVITGNFAVRDSAGNIAAGTVTATAPGGTFNLFDDGGANTLQLIVNADGSVDVQRTAGARTYKVVLNLIWL